MICSRCGAESIDGLCTGCRLDAAAKEARRITYCSHQWIDPEDPPIERSAYSPIIGPGRRQMKEGRTYRCQNCGLELPVKIATQGRSINQ